MQETVEFRIPEEHAAEYLPAEAGVLLGDSVRKIEVSPTSLLFTHIGKVDRDLRRQGRTLFSSWILHRRYTRVELSSADILCVRFRAFAQTAGEEWGTEYVGSDFRVYCGAGERQVSALRLNLGALSRSAEIVKTLAGEIVVAERAANLLQANGVTGAALVLVENARSRRASRTWYQLQTTAPFAEIDPRTRAGLNPFDEDREGRYRCPRGHVLGLNILSEVFIARSSWDGSDWFRTRQLFGDRRGLLRPEPVWLASQRLWQLLSRERVRGLAVEVAHLVEA